MSDGRIVLSEFDALTDTPEAVAAMRAAAIQQGKDRTIPFRIDVAEKAGGMLSRAKVAQLLRVAPATVDELRKRGQILSMKDRNNILLPAQQFKGGTVVLGLAPILAAFGDMNPWGQLQLLCAKLDGFNEEPSSILDMLADGVDDALHTQLIGLVRSWSD